MFSQRVRDLHASPIREILAVVDRPGMISFAGGLPAPASFPDLHLGRVPTRLLQYGPSEGEPELREVIAERLRGLGLPVSTDQVLILAGSQQGIDLVGKLFVDPGTLVAVESPTYLAALQVFRFLGARFVPVGAAAAFSYLIPTFQNPTGSCASSADRVALAETADRLGMPIFEDDPYRDLAYDPSDRTPICSLVERTSWIYQGSFSKTLAPGLRLGFLAASPDLIPYLTRLKQAADLHTNRLSQWIVFQQITDPARDDRLAALVAAYRAKRDQFATALDRHLGGLATWTMPAGGLFFWLTLHDAIDTEALLPDAIANGVAYMPGEPFYPTDSPPGTLRLNFSHASADEADRGLAILAHLLRAHRIASSTSTAASAR